MKVLLKFIFLFLIVLFSMDVNAQEESLTTKRLREQVKDSNNKAILEAANTGDLTLVPYLKELSSNLEGRSNFNHPAFYSHVALAKLGDEEAVQQILGEIDNESSRIQSNAIRKLSLVGGKVAFRKFYELLDDTKPREDTDCLKMFEDHNTKHPENKLLPYCHVVYSSKSVTAMAFLGRMVEDPPTRKISGEQKEIKLWKQWIKKKGYLVD